MKTLRIFISSPGDVSEERDRAKQVVESLRRRYAGKFILKPLLWEELPLQPDMSFQQGIDMVLSQDRGLEIAVFILWSRLGTPLGKTIPRPDGGEYRSGTEREFDLMMQARKQSGGQRPHVLVYTRSDETSFDERLRGHTTTEKEGLLQQKKLVESFIKEEFHDSETGLNRRAYHSFDRPITFSQHLREHLQELLDGLAGGSADVMWNTDDEKQGPPYMGLEAFQPQHADVFFGREEEIIEARHALREQAKNGCAFLLLSGASGSGKSSLTRAGILPAIRDLELDEQVASWLTLIFTPSELAPDPVLSLVTRLADLLPGLRGEAQNPSLAQLAADLRENAFLTVRQTILPALSFASTGKAKGPVRLLLLMDQLEEFFASSAISATDRAAFLAIMEALARCGSVWVLATVRSDFYQQIQSAPALVRMKAGQGQLDVLPPGPDALRRLIEEPARLAGLSFETRDGQSLADRILRDAAAHAELLPLVEFVLRELYEQRTANGQLGFAAYDALGGVEGALARRAESAFRSLPVESQETLATVLQSLVTLGSDTDSPATTDARGERLVRQRATLSTFAENAAARRFVDTFIAERLFTSDQLSATSEPTVTVAHESLLRVWPRAVQWANQNRDFLRTRARIAARMKEGSPLLVGDPLFDTAKSFLITSDEKFSVAERDWIRSAIYHKEAKERQNARRRALAVTALSMLTLISICAAVWAVKSAKEALQQKKEAEAGFEAARSSTDDFLSRIAGVELSYIPGIQDFREEMANKAITQYQSLLDRKPDDRPLQMALGNARLARANILGQIGNLKEANDAFEEAILQIESLEKSHGTKPHSLLLARAHIDYARFRYNENLADFMPNVEEGIRLLEPLIADKRNREAGAYGVIAYNLKGNGESDPETKIPVYEKGRAIALGLAQKELKNDPVTIDIMSGLAATTWNLSMQISKSKKEADLTRSRHLLKESEQCYLDIKKLQPDSPAQQKYTAMLLQSQADDLANEGKTEDARKRYQECVSLWRAAASNNPNVTQFQRGFVLALKDHGVFLSKLGDFGAARSCYEEAALVSEKMIGKRADRPSNGIALLQVFYQLSEFEQYGKTNNDKGDPEAGAKIRERAVNQGRKLAKIYPESIDMRYELGKIMANHARYEPVKSNPIQAATLFREAIALMDKQRIQAPSSLRDWHAEHFLAWSRDLTDILKTKAQTGDSDIISNWNERIQTLELALEWRPYVTGYGSKQALMAVAKERSQMFIESEKFTDSVDLSLEMIRFCESAYLQKPYHYYLRNALAGQYRSLAEAYQKLNETAKELSARQKAIEIDSVPNNGRKLYESVLDPSLPPTIENLAKLRTVNEWGPKSKMFVIPCDVNGVKVPVKFYLHGGTLDKDFDPIADQARWIEEERGIIVPADVRDSLRKLANIAYENKVDFLELCTYALNYPADESAAPKHTVASSKKTTEEKSKPVTAKVPGIAERKAAVDMGWRILEKERIDLVGKINSFAFAALFEGKYSEAEISAREALKLARASHSESVADGANGLIPLIYTNMGHALLFQGKYNDALEVYGEHWTDPMQGRLFKDGVIEDFDLFDAKKITHPDLAKMKSALKITSATPRVKAAPTPIEVPLWFEASMQAGETEQEITKKLRIVIESEIVERNYSRDLWTDDFISRTAKTQFLGYQKAHLEKHSHESKPSSVR